MICVWFGPDGRFTGTAGHAAPRILSKTCRRTSPTSWKTSSLIAGWTNWGRPASATRAVHRYLRVFRTGSSYPGSHLSGEEIGLAADYEYFGEDQVRTGGDLFLGLVLLRLHVNAVACSLENNGVFGEL